MALLRGDLYMPSTKMIGKMEVMKPAPNILGLFIGYIDGEDD